MREDSFRSLNRETGMLEGIEDVRRVVLRLLIELEVMLQHPVILMLLPPGTLVDMASLVVSARSVVQPMSQAEFLRRLGQLMGAPTSEIEELIRESGVSETLPMTHPDSTSLPAGLTPLDPNDPVVKSSMILSEVAKAENDRAREKQGRVDLPPTIEDFLRGLMKED